MSSGSTKDLENSCKNCSHTISLHTPDCTFKIDNSGKNDFCGCKGPEYYNMIVSDKYVGWTEIHCNLCGNMLGFIDSGIENIYDFTTACRKCIRKLV
jgi:hypothetical protein